MEQSSQTELPADVKLLEGQLREGYGRVVYTHKAQEKCADMLLSRLNAVKLYQISLSALTTCGVVTTIFGSGAVGGIVASIFSGLLLFLNTYTKNTDFGTEAQKHRQSAANLWLVREKYISLLTDLRMNAKTVQRLIEERDSLIDALHKVYLGSPATNFAAYSKARVALKENEEMTLSEAEIDALLPDVLRRKI